MELYIVKNDNSKARVQDDFVLGFRVMLERFSDEYKIGLVHCETAKLILSKDNSLDLSDVKAFATKDPNEYYLIDSVDTTNDDYIEYQLTDFVTQLNKSFDYSDLLPEDNSGVLISTLIERIQTDFGGIDLHNLLSLAGSNKVYSCDTTYSYRDFIGWILEIGHSNMVLMFVPSDDWYTSNKSVNQYIIGVTEGLGGKGKSGDRPGYMVIIEASDITIGDTLTVTGIDLNDGIYSYGTNEGYVYHLNPENIIFDNYKTEEEKENKLGWILSGLPNGVITNVKISNYEVDDINPNGYYDKNINSDNYSHNNLKSYFRLYFTYKGKTYQTFNNIDWEFTQVDSATKWLDNFDKSVDFNVKTKQENDTTVNSVQSKLRGIRTLITKTAEEIKLLAESSNNEHERIESLISQTAAEIILTVSEIENGLLKQSTTFVVESDGAYIKQGREGYYSRFTDSGMEVYSDNQRIAEATADTFKAPSFTTDNWTIREEDNGTTLNFFRGNW